MVDDETFKQIDEIFYRWWVRNDDGEFKEFIRFAVPLARNIANRLLRDSDEADDVAQNAMLRLYKRNYDLHGNGSPSKLLCTTVTNLALDVIRKRERFAECIEELSEAETSSSESEWISPLSTIERSEDMAALRTCIDSLSEIRRTIFLLFYFEEMSLKEIAGVVERTLPATRSVLREARKTVRDKMNRLNSDSSR